MNFHKRPSWYIQVVRQNHGHEYMKMTPVEDQPTKVVAFRDAQWKTQWLVIGLAFLFLWRCTVFVDYKWFSQLPWWLLLMVTGLIPQAFLLLFPIITRNPRQLYSFGFPTKTSCLREFGVAVLVVIITSIVLGAINALINYVSPGTSLTPDIFKNMAVSSNHMYVYFLLLFSFTFAPIAEETFFRGFLYNSFRARMPWIIAILIQCLIFGFGHFFGGMHAIVAFFLGVLLTVIYEWRKTLVTPIFVHAGINFVASLGVVFMMVAHANSPVIGVSCDLNSTACVIRQIASDSAAEAADLRVEDIITAFNSVPIRNFQHLSENVRLHKPGDKISITINRAGTVFEVSVVLRSRGKP